MKYIAKTLRCPIQARRIESKVYVEFVVDKEGKIINVKTVKDTGAGCEEEVVRIIKNAPDLKASRQRGQPRSQRIMI